MQDGTGGADLGGEPSSCLPADDQFVGAILHFLLLKQSSWVHRRVETIEVLDEVSVGRRVSIDLTLRSDLDAFCRRARRRSGCCR